MASKSLPSRGLPSDGLAAIGRWHTPVVARKMAGAVIAMTAFACAACGSASKAPTVSRTADISSTTNGAGTTTTSADSTTTTAAVTSATVPDTTPTTTTPASTVPPISLPISISSGLSSPQQDPSVLVPASCRLQGGIVTAQGTLTGLIVPSGTGPGVLPEVYRRFGDVVELYAFSTTDSNPDGLNDVQVLDLGSESTGSLIAPPTWTASAPVAEGFPPPRICFVAIQSTHTFMGGGNAGG